jgi:hypothetical protein
MIKSWRIVLLFVGLWLCAGRAIAQQPDVEGSKDHPLIGGWFSLRRHAVAGKSNEMFSDFQERVIGVPQIAPFSGAGQGNVIFHLNVVEGARTYDPVKAGVPTDLTLRLGPSVPKKLLDALMQRPIHFEPRRIQ